MGTFFFYLLLIAFILSALLLIGLILIQKGRGGGLAGAFGGGGGGNTAFGAKTGDVLTWATSILFGLFLLLAVALNLVARSRHEHRAGVAPEVQSIAPHVNGDGIGAGSGRAI